MTAKFFAILTNQGAAKLANAAALGTRIDLTHIAVGDGGGSLPTPDPAQTALKREKRRAAINMLTIDPGNSSQIIAEQIIPENEGGWWIRELGLFSADGTLIAVANCPETYKPQLQEGSGRTQTIRMVLIVSSTEAVTLKIDPATVLATRDCVDSEVKKHAESRNHPDGTLTTKGFVQLSSATNSTSETLAATPKAVKTVQDAVNALSASVVKSVNSVKADANGAVSIPSADWRNNFAARMGIQRVLNGENPPTSPGVWSVENSKWTPVPWGSLLYTTNQSGLSADTGNGKYHHYIFIAHNGGARPGVYYALNVNGMFSGWYQTFSTANKPSAADVGALDREDFPVGIPQPWPTITVPAGWLKCNGAIFDKVKYPLLAAAYPDGKLPDLRGEFIRGSDDARGVDVGRTVLSAQADAVQKFTGKTNGIQHFIPGLTTEGIVKQGEAIASTSGLTETATGTGNGVFRVEFDASRQIRTAAETRPRNIAFNYIVRAA